MFLPIVVVAKDVPAHHVWIVTAAVDVPPCHRLPHIVVIHVDWLYFVLCRDIQQV